MEWFMEALRKYADFNGRARRKEYWLFSLFNCLIYFAFIIFGFAVAAFTIQFAHSKLGVIAFAPAYIFIFAMIVPGLAVSVRRLHDTGRSGWWLLIGLVPFIGGIVVLIFHCQDSMPGPNEYGPNPKGIPGYGPFPPAAPGY